MRTMIVVTAVACMLALSGCNFLPGTGGTPAPEESSTSAEETPAEETDDLVNEDTLPVGHCGKAPKDFVDQMVYQGSPETDCAEGMTALEALAKGEGDDGEHVAGHGTDVNGWRCLFPMDDEIANYDLTLVCEKGPQKIFVRPASLDVPAGYHVEPWDYGAPPEGLFFTTESRKHHCNFSDDLLGCDNHNFPADLPEISYMGQRQQPTAIVLEAQGEPRFEAHGDPTFTQYSDSGEWGADTTVLGYGELLIAYGIACTTDEDRGVVCTNGDHGFEISSQKYALH